MAAKRDPLPVLGELELMLLERAWDTGRVDVADAHAAIGRRRKITPNTIGSALERLYRKGLLDRTKISHAYRYTPRLTRDEFRAKRVAEAVGGLNELASVGLLSAFVDLVANTDDTALEKLEAL